MALTRYAAVGIAATAAHYALLILLVEAMGVGPGWGAWTGALVGALVAFEGNRRWTFPGTPVSRGQSFARFMAVAAAGSVANGLIVGAGTSWLGVHYLVAQVVATGVVMVVTYHVNRWWTFQLTP